ncbi:unnamed protein product [Ectocarpus sp. 8 AP-2014]
MFRRVQRVERCSTQVGEVCACVMLVAVPRRSSSSTTQRSTPVLPVCCRTLFCRARASCRMMLSQSGYYGCMLGPSAKGPFLWSTHGVFFNVRVSQPDKFLLQTQSTP